MPVRHSAFWLTFAVAASAATTARSATIVWVEPVKATLDVGETVELEVRADIPDAVWGWGLDLIFGSPGVVSVIDVQVNDATWDAAMSPDGDGLVGLAFPQPVQGDNLLLATVTVRGDAMGQTAATAGYTAGDLTEGFPFEPAGFDNEVTFQPANLAVVPEAMTGVLLVGAALLLLCRRR